MRSSAQFRPARRGFTLLELVLVVLCLSVAGMLVAPRLSDQSATKLAQAARLLSADLEYAQAASMAHGDDPCIVVFDTNLHRYDLVVRSAPETPIANPAGRMPYRTQYGSGRAAALRGVRIAALSVGEDNMLGFGPLGELDQVAAARITLVCNGRRVDVTVNPITGQTSVSELY